MSASIDRLPLVMQSEFTECGLACLSMIAMHHGHDLDLRSLRRRFPISLKGASLARVVAIAQQLGFNARAVRAELASLRDLKTPSILHWDLNHFVVLKRADARGVDIHDPAHGRVRLSWAEASRHFTGVAIELTPGADFVPVRDRQPLSLRALIGHVQGLGRAMSHVLLLALALELFALIAPLQLQWVIDQVLVSGDLGLLTVLGIGFLVVTVLQAVLTAARGWAISVLGASVNTQWTSNLFSHLLRLPLDYFEKRHVGEVLSRFTSVQTIQQTLTGTFVETVLDGLTASFMLALLCSYHAGAAAIVLAGLAAYAALRWAGYRPLLHLKEEQLTYAARQQTELFESVHGMQTIKLANKESERHTRVANLVTEVANRDVAVQRMTASFSALAQFLAGAQRVVLIWVTARLVLEGVLSAGMLLVFVAYAEQFTTRTRSLVDKLVEFRLLRVHAERLADIALQEPERDVVSRYGGPQVPARIEIEDLSYRYAEGEPWILKDCSLRIDEGESVAIVGPSGCGKTTLAKLLLGLLQPEAGTVRIGGVDVRRYGLGAYRAQFGVVMQEDDLFAGSIADNIAFFDRDATQERVEAAAVLANIAEDIAAMPMGYETLVGDMGSSLSGGQKQRVLLARALYRQPRILLLDEATSHLDVARERRINSAVARLRITRIIIAHRPDTIASADRVVHLVNGSAQSLSAIEYRQSREERAFS